MAETIDTTWLDATSQADLVRSGQVSPEELVEQAIARGVEQLMGTYRILDLAPLGRNEEGPASWWHRHGEYESA